MKILSFLFFSLFFSSLKAQSIPSEILRFPKIQSLEKRIPGEGANGSSCPSIIREAEEELKRYYSQFTDQKRIQDERDHKPQDYRKFDQNTVRLIDSAQRGQLLRSYFLRESPYLFRLHVVIGRCHSALGKSTHAVSHYTTAFRYASWELPLKEDPKQEKEKIYLAMNRVFADPERIKEEEVSQTRQDASRFPKELDQYFALKKEYSQAVREIDVQEAKAARGKKATVAQAIQERDSLKQKFESQTKVLENIRNTSYQSYLKRRNQFHADTAYRTAKDVKKLELENQIRFSSLNRSSFLRGRGIQAQIAEEDRTRLKNFTGYRALLQLAHKFDPTQLEYIRLLSDSFFQERFHRKALHFTSLYIQEAEQKKLPFTQVKSYYRRLGRIQTEKRNFLKATKAYEKFLQLDPEPSSREKAETMKYLADLYFKRTGGLAKADELYKNYLRIMKNENNPEPNSQELVAYRILNYKVFRNLSSIAAHFRNTQEEKENLEKAQAIFSLLEQEKEEAQKMLESIQKEIQSLKRQLLGTKNEELQDRYYRLQRIEVPPRKEKVEILTAKLRALRYPELLEKVAFLAYKERNWSKAEGIYREIIVRGSGKQAERAQKNLRKLELHWQDGRFRPLL